MRVVGGEDLRKVFFFSRPGFVHLLNGVYSIGGSPPAEPRFWGMRCVLHLSSISVH